MQQWQIKNLDSDTQALLPSLQQYYLPTLIGSSHFSQQVETKKKKVWRSVNSHLYKWIFSLFSFVASASAE